MQGGPEQSADRRIGWQVLAAVVVLAGLGWRALGFSLTDIGYSDELMQYLEPTFSK